MLGTLFFLLLLVSINVRAQPSCGINGNYTRNSAYEANLNTALSSIVTNIDDNGFYNASVGRNGDRVNAIALCRGDTQLEFCRSCVRNASNDIVSSCPNRRDAIIWSEYCMLRYSNESIFGIRATYVVSRVWNLSNVTNPVEFSTDLITLLDNLRGQASSGGPLIKVGYGDRSTSSTFRPIYGLVQCTPDLSPQDCESCLVDAAAILPNCCYASIGARVLLPSCNIRYETTNTPFYNETRLQELVQLSRTPPPSSAPPTVLVPSPPPPAGSKSITISS